MSDDGKQAGGAAPNEGQNISVRAGQFLPYFRKRGRPSPFSAHDMNRLVRAINNFLGMRLRFTEAEIDINGNAVYDGKLISGDTGAILELAIGDATGTSSSGGGHGSTSSSTIEMMTVNGYTSTNNYLSATRADGSTVVNVALPIGLRVGSAPTGSLLYGTAGTWALNLTYTAGDKIFACSPTGGTGVSSVTWLDMNSGCKYWKFTDTSGLTRQAVAYTNTACATVHRDVIGNAEY